MHARAALQPHKLAEKIMAINYLKMWKNALVREMNSRRIRALNSIIFVTYRCTSRCITCNMWQRSGGRSAELIKKELTVAEGAQIIDKLSGAGVNTVEIFGGDALLRKDLTVAMIQKCTALGMDTFFATNAMLLDADAAQQLVAAGLGRIYFSLDGTDDIHNRIRGINHGYMSVKSAIWNTYQARSKAGQIGPQIGVIITVSRSNVEELIAIVAHLERFPLDFVELQIVGQLAQADIDNSVIEGKSPTPLFTATSEHSNLLLPEQVPILNEAIVNLRARKKALPFKLNLYHLEPYTAETYCKGIFPSLPCHWCTTVATLTPEADVVPCPNFTEYVLGNLNQEGALDTIWGNAKHRRFVNTQRSGSLRICHKCSMRHSYPGLRENLRLAVYPYGYAQLKKR